VTKENTGFNSMLPTKASITFMGIHRLKLNKQEKHILCTWKLRRPRVAIFILHKIQLKSKTVKWDKEVSSLYNSKGINSQKDTTIVNVSVPGKANINWSEKRNKLQYNNRGFWSSGQKTNKETWDLNYALGQMNLRDIQNVHSSQA
jgi:hypothetical protein